MAVQVSLQGVVCGELFFEGKAGLPCTLDLTEIYQDGGDRPGNPHRLLEALEGFLDSQGDFQRGSARFTPDTCLVFESEQRKGRTVTMERETYYLAELPSVAGLLADSLGSDFHL